MAGGIENLRPPKTTEEAKARGKQGGIRSGIVKREKKLLSQIYAELLAKSYDINGEKLTIEQVVQGVLSRQDSASVSMLKEIREATEGSKLTVDATMTTPVPFTFVDPPEANADTSEV